MRFWLLFFLALSVVLTIRLYRLGDIPHGLYVDQASIGYTAYSLLTTGRDEYGFPLPIFARSFGIYIPTPAIYLATVPIGMFGLTPFALRLVPFILGLLTCYATALLAAKFFPGQGKTIFAFSFLILGLSPIHLLYSRDYFESSLGLLFFVLSLHYLLKHKFTTSMVLLSLATYSYHSYRLIGYLFLGTLLVRFKRHLLTATIIFGLSQLPQLYLSTFAGPVQRFVASTWLGTPGLSPLTAFLSRYLDYYSPFNLFFAADPDPLRSLPELGVFFAWQIVPWLVGLYVLIKTRLSNYIFWTTALVAPVAAALTRDPFSLLRANLVLVPTTIVISLGIMSLLRNGVRYHLALGFLSVVSLIFLCRSLLVLLPAERSERWAVYQSVFARLADSSIPAIVDDDKPVYALYLFYNQVSPRYVQTLQPLSWPEYYTNPSWQDYYTDPHVTFRPITWKTDVYTNLVLIGDQLAVSPDQAKEHFLTKTLTYSTFGHEWLVGWQTDPTTKQLHSPQ